MRLSDLKLRVAADQLRILNCNDEGLWIDIDFSYHVESDTSDKRYKTRFLMRLLIFSFDNMKSHLLIDY